MRALGVAVLGVLALGAPPAVAGAPAQGRVIAVPAGHEEVVDVGPYDELIPLQDNGIEVERQGPSGLRIDAARPGRALLMIRSGTVYESVIVEAEPVVASSATRSRRAARSTPGAPRLAVGGSYWLSGGSGRPVGGTLIHWTDWSQRIGATNLEALASLQVLLDGRAGVNPLLLRASGPWGWGQVGDTAYTWFDGETGLTGAGAYLRGLDAAYRVPGKPLYVRAVGGAYHDVGCCQYFAPSRVLLGAGEVGWDPPSGLLARATAGVARDDAGRVFAFAGARGGWRAPRWQADLGSAWAGGGGAIDGEVSGSPVHGLRLEAVGGYVSATFHRPIAPLAPAVQAAGQLTARYAGAGPVGASADLRVVHRGPSGTIPSLDTTDLRAFLFGRLGPNGRVYAGYTYSAWTGIAGTNGHGIAAGGEAKFVKRLEVRAGASAFVPSHLARADPRVYGSVDVGARVLDGLMIGGRYQVDGSITPDKPLQQLGGVWVRGGASPLYAFGEWYLLTSPGAAGSSLRTTLHGTVAWRLRRIAETRVYAQLTTPVDLSQPSWSVGLSWVLRPTALLKQPGDLGFRGRTGGQVFLDQNANGVLDADEHGLAGMHLTLDGREQVTGPDGSYLFRGVPAGPHELTLDRGNMESLNGAAQQIDVAPLARTEQDFSMAWGSEITGTLYQDLDGSGDRSPGDPPVNTEHLLLRNAAGVVIDEVHTTQGSYAFQGLAPGDYTVVIDPLGLADGYVPAGPVETEVKLGQQEERHVDLPIKAIRAIGGVVWHDMDGDGAGGSKADVGLGGVAVHLSNRRTVRTGPDGSYLFRNLKPGAYSVTTELSDTARVVLLSTRAEQRLHVDFVIPKNVEPAPPSGAKAAPLAPARPSALVLHSPVKVLPQGVEVRVTATASLSTGQTRKVTSEATWSSSDPSVLSVGGDGVVEGKRAGQAGVSAEWHGEIASPLPFEVLAPRLDHVAISPVALSLNPGDTATLRVDVIDAHGRGGNITPLVTWQVTDPTVAAVDPHGKLHALRDGSTTVRAQIDGHTSGPIPVHVMTAKVTALSVEGLPVRMPPGSQATLKAVGYDTDLGFQDVSRDVTWTSSDPSVLRITQDGVAHAIAAGIAEVTASIGSISTRTRNVAVTAKPPDALQVIPSAIEIGPKDHERLRAVATFEDGTRGTVTGVVTWTVDGAQVAILPDGTIEPKQPGKVTVTATLLGVTSPPVEITVRR